MRTQLQNILRPPIFDDEDQTRAAGILHVILLTLFVVFAILAALTDHPRTVLVTAGMSALFFCLWWVMRRGFVKLAGWGLMSILIIGVTAIIYFNGSIRVPAAAGFVACLVVTGLTLGKRATIGFTALICGILFVLYRMEIAGKLPPIYYQTTGFLQWATYAGIMAITAVLLILAQSSILNALSLARQNAQALSERNQELHAEIDERQQIECALRESEERYRTLISTSPDGIAQTDLNGNIIFASPQLLNLFGLVETSQMLNTEISAWIAPEDRQRARENVRSTLENCPRPYSHYACIRRDNSRFTVEFNSAPWRNTAGKICGTISMIRDITERKQVEQALADLHQQVEHHAQELEERVAERTAQLSTTNQELETFSYSVAHDLRTPLRAIDGFSRVLLEEHTSQLDEQGRFYLNRIMAANQRMSQLIDDLLSLSRLTRSELKREHVDLSEMARSILDELQQREPERQVETLIASDLITEADPRLLHVVLENLLGNAWKFTVKTPNPSIEFGAQPGKPTTYFVCDNGAGFDMTYSNKLFGAFQRLHADGEFPGTGVGLATVKRIVLRHGGEVWATGEVDQGATFYFTLP